jgi:S-adenosylmethionine hydrolase
MGIITLLTDFGTRDAFVGAMKGVILSDHSEVSVVDISHDIEPGNVFQAMQVLTDAWQWFPANTVHTVVVDPGVGTDRSILAARAGGHFFLAPDNGVLTSILRHGGLVELYRVESDSLYRQPVSRTFHGRDIFAPVAAWVSRHGTLEGIGPGTLLENTVLLDTPRPDQRGTGELAGHIVHVDRFGNLLTNLHEDFVSRQFSGGIDGLTITVGSHRIFGLSFAYGDVPHGSPLAILSSNGYLEIAVSGGSAADALELGVGRSVLVGAGDAGASSTGPPV